MNLPDDFIAEVRSRANILEVVSEHVTMQRKGANHFGRCPFHEEKSGSFSVNADKGYFKCFGCGEKGNVFTFLMKIKGLNFPESVKELAQKYGIQIPENTEQREEYDKKAHILMLYQQASQYFINLMKDPTHGVVARDYLEKRGIPEEIIEQFKIGYAGPTWDGLLNYLTSTTKVAPATLEEAGLVRRKADSNHFYDLFRNRLMIPICDKQGRVIAFGGRTLGNDDAKYVNSPESPIYTKGNHLYAFNVARDSIRARDSVIVVEGYFDAITPHQFGFTNTVATLGTALTEQQARALVQFTDSKRVYLAFDADSAGMKAVERGAETLQQIGEYAGVELRVIRIPGAKDPDECLRSEGGPEAFAAAIANAPLLIDYQLEQAIEQLNVSTPQGKIEAANAVVPILAPIANSVKRTEYIRIWAMRVGVLEENLQSDVNAYRTHNRIGMNAQNQRAPRPRASQKSSIKSGHTEAEQQLLALFFTSKDDHERTTIALHNEYFLTPVHQFIKETVEGVGKNFQTVDELQHRLMDKFAPEPEVSAAFVEVLERVDELRKQNSPIGTLLLHFKERLLRERIFRLLTTLKTLLSSAEDESDLDALQSRIIYLKQLENAMRGIETLEDLDELKRKIEADMEA
ncbi:MAG TPA: DNA primase [Drouetiella sp.]